MPVEPMKNHVIRVPEPLWQRALARADERNERLSVAIRRMLEEYAK